MSLSKLLRALEEEGCYPSIRLLGPKEWRAHINGADHFANGRTPRRALDKALILWEKAGRPMYIDPHPITSIKGES